MKLVPDYYGVASNQIGPFSMTSAGTADIFLYLHGIA